jgi:hypothetical protein
MDSKQNLVVIPFLVLVSAASGVSCNYSFNNYNPSSDNTFTLTIANLENASILDGEKTATSFRLLKTGTAEYGCDYDSTAAHNTDVLGIATESSLDTLTSNSKRSAVFVTPPVKMNLQAIKMMAFRSGGAAGTVSVDINSAQSSVPTAASLGSTQSRNMLDISADAENWIQFDLASPLAVSNQTELALILKPSFSGTPNGVNYITLVSTSDYDYSVTDPIACNAFPVYKASSNGGSTWSDPWNNGSPVTADLRRGYFLLVADVHRPTANGHWVVDGTDSMDWDMSTFTITEGMSSLGGQVTYDVGSANTNTPVYTQSGLSKSQVQALTGITGQYLFIKVNLTSSASPYFERAEVSEATIQATKSL